MSDRHSACGATVTRWGSAASVLVMLLAPDHAAEAARRCRSPLSVTGPLAATRELAEEATLRAWSAQAAKLGATFKTWDNAIGRDLPCETVSPADAPPAIQCTANGSPCAVTNAR